MSAPTTGSTQGIVPGIVMVYPRAGHRTFEASVFVMGRVPAGARLTVQDKAAPVSPSGYFSFQTPLRVGENRIVLRAVLASGTALTQSLAVTRDGALPVLSAGSKAAVEWHAPSGEVFVSPGDRLRVAFRTLPGARVTLLLPGVLSGPLAVPPAFPEARTAADGMIDNREEIFLEPHQTVAPVPRAGWYETEIAIPVNAAEMPATPLLLNLAGWDAPLAMPVSVGVWRTPRRARVKTDRAIVRDEPAGGRRLTPYRQGAEVWVDARQAGWCRVRLAPHHHAWVAESDLAWLPAADARLAAPYTLVSEIAWQPQTERGGVIALSCPQALPLAVEARPREVAVTLYGATAQCVSPEAACAAGADAGLVWEQAGENVLRVRRVLEASETITGFDYSYQARRHEIAVKTLPRDWRLASVVIDPGHGGTETGSTAPSGMPEKRLNLTVSNLLKDALLALGFSRVALTRAADETVSLEARAARALAAQADVIVSVHHNALPDGRDPARYEGACTFYYHDFAKPLAAAIQRHLVGDAGTPDFGVLHNNLFIPRIHQAASVLVELGFFTHPAELERLLNPAFQQRAARAMARGIQAFCQGEGRVPA